MPRKKTYSLPGRTLPRRQARAAAENASAQIAAEAAKGRRKKERATKPDCLPFTQTVLENLLARVANDDGDEIGLGEARLLELADGDKERAPELLEGQLDAEDFDEKDKSEKTVQTLDNFAVYDDDGHLVDLRDVWLMPGLLEDLTVFGTVVAPLRYNGHALVRTPRASAPAGSHEQVIEMLDSRLIRIASSSAKKAVSTPTGGSSGKSSIKVPHFDPNLTREVAYAQAQSLQQATPAPFTVGGITVQDVGEIHLDRKYYSSKHLFPVGFRSQRQYTCAVSPTEKAVYTSEILEGVDGPRFRVIHENGDLSWEEASSSAVWLQVLRHVNDCKVRNGLPSKGTAISGPEMFGFANAKIASVLEGLDGVINCTNYTFRAMRGGGYGGMHTRNRRLDELDGGGQGEAYFEDAEADDAASTTGGKRAKSRSRPSAPAHRRPKSMTVKDTQYLTRAGTALADLQEKENKGLRVLLKKLATCSVNADLLHDTGAARIVKRLRKHPDKKIAPMAKEIVRSWKMHGDKEPSKKDVAVVTDCCAKIITYIGVGPDEKMQDAVADKYIKNARGAQRKKIFELLVRLDRIKFVDTETLINTMMGKLIGRLRKHLDPDISALALSIKERWQRQIKDPEGEQYEPSPAQLMTFRDLGAGGGGAKAGGDDSKDATGASAKSSAKASSSSQAADGSAARDANGAPAGGGAKGSNHAGGSGKSNNKDGKHGKGGKDAAAMEVDTSDTSGQKKRKRGSSSAGGGGSGGAGGGNSGNGGDGDGPKSAEDEEDTLRARKRSRRAKSPGSHSHMKKLTSMDPAVVAEEVAKRPRQRVKLDRVTRLSMTLAYGDPTLWLETEKVRYRIAGPNVPVAPAVHYADTFARVWKIFEACHRFLHLIDSCERSTDLDSILLEATQDNSREMPRRRGFKAGDDSAEAEFQEGSVQLTEDDILESVYYVVEELYRMLANEKDRIPMILGMRAMNDYISRGLRDMDRSSRNYVKRERIRITEEAKEASKTEKQRERDAQRRELEQRRMIENGIGLPDDLEIVEEDREREAAGKEIASAFVAALAHKEKVTKRPVPRFLPCDPAFVDFDRLLQYRFSSSVPDANFKDAEVGAWAGFQPGSFSVEGMRFAMMLQLWSTVRTVMYIMDDTFMDRNAFAEETFAIFRERFVKSGADDVCMALVKFLCDQVGGEEDSSFGRANSRFVYGVEDTAGISTRRSGRSHRKSIQLAGHDAAVPSYPYNSDELWPAPVGMINEMSWPEIARRLLLHQLRTDEDLYLAWQFNPENQHPGQPQRQHRDLTLACLEFDPDLLSTCDELLMEIMDDVASPPFCVPVDPMLHDAPNYFEIIKRPMDLETIRKRMHDGHYDADRAPEGNRYQEAIDWRRGTTGNDDDDDGASQQVGGATPAPDEDVDMDEEEDEDDEDGEEKPVVEDLLSMDARFYEFDCLGSGHEGLAADVRQVFRNCRRFNKSHTKLYNDARKLDGMFSRVYEERVIRRDPKYRLPPVQVPGLLEGVAGVEMGGSEATSPMAALKLRRGNKFVDVDKAENTTDFAGPFQKGMPILQEALLSLNQSGDLSLVSVDEKLRLATALTDMAMDTRAMRSFIQVRIEELHRLSREQQQVQREVQRAEKDLSDKGDKLHARREELEATRVDLERQIRERAIRMEPVGYDRYFNRYWVFDTLALPVVFVEMARTGQWGVFWSQDEVKQLLASLDIRGARENALYHTLSDLWASFLRAQAQAQQELSATRIQKYVRGKSDTADGDSRVVKLAKILLSEAEKQLAEAAEKAKIWRTVQTEDGREYYYHAETRETTWETPELHKAEAEFKEKVEECRANVEKAKEDPEEALEALKQDLMNDNVLIHALTYDARAASTEGADGQDEEQQQSAAEDEDEDEDKKNDDTKTETTTDAKTEPARASTVTIDDLRADEATFLNKSRVEGFVSRILRLVASLLALESLTVGHGANPNLSCKSDEWLSENKQSDWFEKTNEVISVLKSIKNEPNPAWVKIRPVLVDVMGTYFDLFVGSPYAVNHDKAQRAVIMATRHAFRFHRALRAAQSLADFGLLFAQMQNILHMKRTVTFTRSRDQSFAVLLADVMSTSDQDETGSSSEVAGEVKNEKVKQEEEEKQETKQESEKSATAESDPAALKSEANGDAVNGTQETSAAQEEESKGEDVSDVKETKESKANDIDAGDASARQGSQSQDGQAPMDTGE
ncbi:Histone-lysine N-methyltransferase trr [Hondaea fermentalgiana]|uniref:SET domain-containing protein 2 n=1 Tax=Hondaea fermentalgiana TaxID=2315210 RepID=A0A2R5FZ96_9STRA|nr:Histone-lysine N-methyltransferase trr [Hondaea fermentalgiana]|eukprot:GBG24072.1 Histone-lysine N-methyltransferase trr [Hondaea fermentalgiana]